MTNSKEIISCNNSATGSDFNTRADKHFNKNLSHLSEASVLNLLNAVDNHGGYLGSGDWSKVSKSGLSAKYVNLMEAKIWD